MRSSLLILVFAFMTLPAAAVNWYLSTTSGDDSRTAAQAQNPATPWKTIAKMNTVLGSGGSVAAGDSILFRRGETFPGSLIIRRSGTSSARIVVSAWGAGAKPIIDATVRLTSWTSLGGGLYRSAPISTSISYMELGFVDGRYQWQGVTPNYDSVTRSSFNQVKSSVSTTQFKVSKTNAAVTNWTGTELIVRVNRYILERRKVSAHTDSTFTTSSGFSYAPKNGYGVWITSDPRTCDQHGEWYYNPSTKEVTMYLALAPANYNISFPAYDVAVDCYAADYIEVRDLEIYGANESAIYFYSSLGARAIDNTIRWCGQWGIQANQSDNDNMVITGNNISHCGFAGIDVRGSVDGCQVSRNLVTYIGWHEVFGSAGASNGARVGIFQNAGNNNEIAFNETGWIGYCGIRWGGSNIRVHHNYVHRYGFVIDDVGGIYTGNPTRITSGNQARRVDHNIVVLGLGAMKSAGLSSVNNCHGIYHDDFSNQLQTDSNYVSNDGDASYYAHQNINTNTFGNIFFGGGAGRMVAYYKNDNPKDPPWYTRSIIFKHNTLILRKGEQAMVNWRTTGDSSYVRAFDEDTTTNSFTPLGTDLKKGIDSNRYFSPIGGQNHAYMQVTFIPSGATTPVNRFRSLAQWKSWWSHDANSSAASPKFFAGTAAADTVYHEFINPSETPRQFTLTRALMDLQGATYNAGDQITLQPYEGRVMLANVANIPPTVPPVRPPRLVRHGIKERRMNGKVLRTL